MSEERGLHAANFKWLLAFVLFDSSCLAVLALIGQEGAGLKDLATIRTAVIAAAPVPLLFLVSVLSGEQKATLVFWRMHHPLPGSEAFSVHALDDSRVDLKRLRGIVGEWPVGKQLQNRTWYGLYLAVKDEPSVRHAHGRYLLFRDAAAVALLLLPMLVLVSGFFSWTVAFRIIVALLLLAQYVCLAFVASANGVQLVRNVLAIRSHR